MADLGAKMHLRRKVVVALIVLLVLAAALTVFFQFRDIETERLRARFERDASLRSELIKRKVDEALLITESLARFLTITEHDIVRAEFAIFAQPLLTNREEISLFAWVPKVPAEQRAEFERAISADFGMALTIWEPDPSADGSRLAAGKREVYYPIRLAEVEKSTSVSPIGFDAGSTLDRLEALEVARDSGEPVAAFPSRAIGGGSRFFIAVPVYKLNMSVSNVGQRRAALRGFVAVGFKADQMLEKALYQVGMNGIDLSIDVGLEGQRKTIYRTETRESASAIERILLPHDLRFADKHRIGGREWNIRFTASRAYVRENFLAEYELVPAFFLVLGGAIVAVYMYMVLSQRERLQVQVGERTAQLAEETRRAQEEERSFRAIVEAAPMAIIVATGSDNRIRFINPRCAALFGYTMEDLLAAGDWWSLLCSEQLAEPVADGEQVETKELRVACKDGSQKIIDWGMVAVGDRKLIFGLDLTARKEYADELIAYREHLEAMVQARTAELRVALTGAESANRAKSAFLSNMSHELRTPLNAVIGFSQLMARSPDIGETQKSNLDIISRAGCHLLTLINDVLELAKIEAGHVQTTETATDVASLVRDTVNMLRPRADQGGLALILEMSDVPPLLAVDAVKLRQILINLISNAIKFTRRGAVTLTLRGWPIAAGKVQLAFAVKDTGIGMAEEEQHKVFEPFVQLVTHASAAGTGLGLTITRQYLRMLGGELRLESTLGQGSIFHFELELATGEPMGSASPAISVAGQVIGPSGIGWGRQILIAEDNADARLLLKQLLEPLGFEVVEAADGAQALSCVQGHTPDLIVMDWRMPVMDGLEATQRIRALGLQRPLPILMLTASVFQEQKKFAEDLGVDAFLRKPVQFAEFFETLERLLGIDFERAVPAPGKADEAAEDAAELAREDLMALPDAVRSALRDAAMELNRAKLDAVLEGIAQSQPRLAHAIERMATAFRYKELWELLS